MLLKGGLSRGLATKSFVGRVLCSVLFCAHLVLHGQELEWVRSVGGSGNEQVNSIALDHLGEAYLALNCAFGLFQIGSVRIENGTGASVVLTKYRTNGELAWVGYLRTSLDRGKDGRWLPNSGIIKGDGKVVTDADGFAYLAGTFYGTVQWVGPQGPDLKGRLHARGSDAVESLRSDIFLLKLSPDGELIWARTYGSSAQEEFLDLALCDDTLALSVNAVGSGKIGPFPTTDENFAGHQWVAACDLDGTVRWVQNLPSSNKELPVHIGVSRGGEVQAATVFSDAAQIGTNAITLPVNSLLVRLDGRGQILGATPSTTWIDALASDVLGNAYLTGRLANDMPPYSGRVGQLDIQGEYYRYTAKVAADGQALWGGANGVSGLGLGPDGLYGAGMVGTERRFGSTVLKGRVYSDAFAGRWTFDGTPAWGEAYADNGEEDGRAIAVADGGEVWLAGTAYPHGPQSVFGLQYFGETDVFIARFKPVNAVTGPPPNLAFADLEIAVKTNGFAPIRILSDVPVRSNLVIRLGLTLANGNAGEVELSIPSGSRWAAIEVEERALLAGGNLKLIQLSGDAEAAFVGPNIARFHSPGDLWLASQSFALDSSGKGEIPLQRSLPTGAPVRGAIVDLTLGEEVGHFWFPPGKTNAVAEVQGLQRTTRLGLRSDEAFITPDVSVEAIVPPQIIQWCCAEAPAYRDGTVVLQLEADGPVRETVLVSGELRLGTVLERFNTTIPKGSRAPEVWPRFTNSVFKEIGGEAVLTQLQSDTAVQIGERRSILIRPVPSVSFATGTAVGPRKTTFYTQLVLSAPYPEAVTAFVRRWVHGVPDQTAIYASSFFPNETRLNMGYILEEGTSYVLEEFPPLTTIARPRGYTRLEMKVLPPAINIHPPGQAIPGETLHIPLNFVGVPASPTSIGFHTEPASGNAGRDFPLTNGVIRLNGSGEVLLPIPATARAGTTFKLVFSDTDEAVLTTTKLLLTVPVRVSFSKSYFIKEADGSASIGVQLAEPLDVPLGISMVIANNESTTATVNLTIPAGQTNGLTRVPFGRIDGDIRLSLQSAEDPLVQLSEPANARVLPAGANAETQIVSVFSYTDSEKVLFSLRRFGPFTELPQLNYATRDGTAIAGRDYVAASGRLTLGEPATGWAAGASIEVRRLAANASEDREFYLDLSDVPPNVLVFGDRTARLPAILPVTPFTINAPSEVSEGSKFVDVQIKDQNQTATFEAFTSDGTARAGTDYEAVRTTLSSPGTVRVPLGANDTRVEPVKFFTLYVVRTAPDRLTNSVNILIRDDERGGARDETFPQTRLEPQTGHAQVFGGVTSDDRIFLCDPAKNINEYDPNGRLLSTRPFPRLPGSFQAGLVLPDGKLLIGTAGDELGMPSVYRLFPDGRWDTAFTSEADQSSVLGLADGGSGKTLVFKHLFLEHRWMLVRLLENGMVDPDFPPVLSEPDYGIALARLEMEKDGSVLAALQSCDWRWGCSLGKLLQIKDGKIITLDTVANADFSFPRDTAPRWFPHALPGGGTYLENLYPYGDVDLGYVVRADGSLDENFAPLWTDAWSFQYLGGQHDGSIIGFDSTGFELVRLRPGPKKPRAIILESANRSVWTEGNSNVLTLDRTGESSEPIEFRLRITDGTASPEDFAGISKTFRFEPMQTSISINVEALADQLSEGEEWSSIGVEPLSQDVNVIGGDVTVVLADSDPYMRLELRTDPALLGFSNEQDVFVIEASDDGGKSWQPIEAVRGGFRRDFPANLPHRIYRTRRN